MGVVLAHTQRRWNLRALSTIVCVLGENNLPKAIPALVNKFYKELRCFDITNEPKGIRLRCVTHTT